MKKIVGVGVAVSGLEGPSGVGVVGFVFAWGAFGFGCLRWEKGWLAAFLAKHPGFLKIDLVIL